MFICWCLVRFPAVLFHMYQAEGVHSSLFLLVIHPNERTLQWGCQHSKQWLLQHTVSNYSDAAVSSTGSRWTSPGVSFYLCVVSQVAMFSVCALGVYPKYGPDVVCHEVVVDIQGQGELRVNLNCRSLDHCQAIWMQLFTTFAHTRTQTKKKLDDITKHWRVPGEQLSQCALVRAPEAACSSAASSAGMGRVVTLTTSLFMRSYTRTHTWITHRCYLNCPFRHSSQTSSAFRSGSTTVWQEDKSNTHHFSSLSSKGNCLFIPMEIYTACIPSCNAGRRWWAALGSETWWGTFSSKQTFFCWEERERWSFSETHLKGNGQM